MYIRRGAARPRGGPEECEGPTRQGGGPYALSELTPVYENDRSYFVFGSYDREPIRRLNLSQPSHRCIRVPNSRHPRVSASQLLWNSRRPL